MNMDSFGKKIRLIYFPFLIIAFSFIILYTFLHWVLLVRTNSFSINESLVNFWLPMGLSWIPVILWLRLRIKILNLKTNSGNLPSLYLFIAVFSVAVPAIIAQEYIDTAAGKLTVLQDIKDIRNIKPTKYYQIRNFFIDKRDVGIHPSFDASGKNNEYFNMHLYVVLPILSDEHDTSGTNCNGWLGIEYSQQLSNRLSDEEKTSNLPLKANMNLTVKTSINSYILTG
jgi:rhomboid protease GluP